MIWHESHHLDDHDIEVIDGIRGAREVGDALVFMDEGVIVEAGKPKDVVSNPQHERTRRFLSKVL